MYSEEINNTSLWRTAFSCAATPMEQEAIDRLKGEFSNFRSRTNFLVGHVSKSLPDLTLHDVSHLDALWRVGSLLAGENYPINPMEAFVLGGSILLHDAALCIEAYEGGIDGLRSERVWKDTFALEMERTPGRKIEEIESDCDFSAMRALHANRAGELAQYAWKHPKDGSSFYLISDPTLRNHVGKFIGKIATSHHWSIEQVKDQLSTPLNPPAGYPAQWSIDGIKIACLLRTADAAHFCQDRAPDFLHALKRRIGVSGNHWDAQNKITGPALSPADPNKETITYTSTQDFLEIESKAWWVAYEALGIVQKEISSANKLLIELNHTNAPALRIKNIAGHESISRFSQYIKASGWEPCNISIHIGDVESLVRNLGGEKLYGANSPTQKLHVVLRELIQNARDSIVALRTIEPDFIGRINIRFINDGNDQYLQIEDDGVGMSRRVLTGALLDFGNSFWASDLVKTELPGLRAAGYKSVGKFGIGFYSIFMLAASASVSSRRWNNGHTDTVELFFPEGLSLRPIVKNTPPAHHRRHYSTTVKIKLLEEQKITNFSSIKISSGYGGINEYSVPLGRLIASWVPGLDVPVYYTDNSQEPALIHPWVPKSQPEKYELLKSIYFPEHRGEIGKQLLKNIELHASHLRPVGTTAYGIAAIQMAPGNADIAGGIRTIGGFGPFSSTGEKHFIGYIECEPDSARRNAEKFAAPPEIIKKWATEQLAIFEESNPSELQRAIFGASLCEFGVSPSAIVRILAATQDGYKFFSVSDLATAMRKTPIIFPQSDYSETIDVYAKINSVEGAIVVHSLIHGKFANLKLNNGIPDDENSLLGCLYYEIKKSGTQLVKVPSDITFESQIGTAKAFMVSIETK